LVCSILPDLDVISFIFGVNYNSFFGHRGFSHSLFFALGVGWLSGSIYLRTFKVKSMDYLRWVIYFALVTLSHSVLDAMTSGGHGIAFFSPFDNHRYFHQYHPIYVSPLSIQEFFSLAGVRVLLSETLFVGIPCLIWVFLTRARSLTLVFKWIQISISFLFLLFFMGIVREELVSSINGVNVYKIEPTLLVGGQHGLSELPTENLPGNRLVVNYDELVKYGLFNQVLIPKKIPWAGSFFPLWLGGVAGRWQDLYLFRVWKSIWGDLHLFSPQSKPQLLELLFDHSPSLLRISPTEKYDIAVGDYYRSATRAESAVRGYSYLNSHPNTPFWEGYCHSMSMAAISEMEPKREVKVLNPDGYEVTFYPNDIKALLGIAYLFPSSPVWDLGNRCHLDGAYNEACVDVNPASLVIAITNLIGLAKTTFIVDLATFNPIRNGPIRKAEIRVINPPYFPADRKNDYEVDDLFIKALLDVEIHLTVSKMTQLTGELDEESLIYRATLGLDSKMNLVGGRWEDPFHHPDFAWGSYKSHNKPEVFGNFIKANVKIENSILRALVEQSASSVNQDKPILVSGVSTDPVMHGFSFSSVSNGIYGRISYLNYGSPVEAYGYITGKDKDSVVSVELVDAGENPQSASIQLASEKSQERRHFKLKTSGSIENQTALKLRVNKKDSSLEFLIPTRKKFESRLIKEANDW
jgi:inner membrane protein